MSDLAVTIVLVLIEVVALALVVCIQTFFYQKTIGLAAKWRGRRLVLVMLASSVIGAVLVLVTLNASSPLADVAGVAFFVALVLYPTLFMGGTRWERVFFGIVNIAVLIFASLLCGFALNAIVAVLPNIQAVSTFFEVHIVQGPAWVMVLIAFVLLIIIYGGFVALITRLNTEGKRFMPRTYWLGLMIGFSVVAIGLGLLNNLSTLIQDAQQFYAAVAIGLLIFLVVWLLLYFIFYFVCRYFSKAAETNMLAVQNDMIERYLLRKQASDERVRILSHDLKHSLAQWRTLAEAKGDAPTLQSIAEYEEQLRSTLLFQVGNESANAIVNQKAWEARQAGVVFTADGVFHEDLLVNKLDLCSLLGNLLDNAVEAAAQAETEGLRRVRLSIRRKGNLLVVIVENGYKLEPVRENGEFVTLKEDKEHHAIGMLSVRYVVEKYAGIANYSYESNWFKATVMLCAYEEAAPDVCHGDV